MQVRVRRSCEDCGGKALVAGPMWLAYYADRVQQQRESAAMEAAPTGQKLDARLKVFHAWWAERLGCAVSIVDGSPVLEVPPEEVPCGECVDGWVERWVPLEELAAVPA